MSESYFQELVQGCVLISPERKKHYLDLSSQFTPEIREKLAQLIRSAEEALLSLSYEQDYQVFHEAFLKLQKQLEAFELFHRQEIKAAERQLEKDLALIA